MKFEKKTILDIVTTILSFLGILGINQWDKAAAYFNRTFYIYKTPSEIMLTLDQNKTVYSTKLRIGNDFSTNVLNTDNINEKPYLDYSFFNGKIEKLYLINADNVQMDVDNNIEKKRIYLNFKYMEYSKEVFLFIITDKYLDTNNIAFHANLTGTKSETVIKEQENIITSNKNILIFFGLAFIFIYFFWSKKKESDEYKKEIMEKQLQHENLSGRYAQIVTENVEKGNKFEQEIFGLKSEIQQQNEVNKKLQMENIKLQIKEGTHNV